jgi:hypothetical protein
MRIETIIDDLTRAFPPYSLDAAPSGDPEWPEMSSTLEFLERNHDALMFLGPAVLGDYLPAFLAAVLRRAPELDVLPTFLIRSLTHGVDIDRVRARVERFTFAQRRAVENAIAALETIHERRPTQRMMSSRSSSPSVPPPV